MPVHVLPVYGLSGQVRPPVFSRGGAWDRLGQILRDIQIPDVVLRQLERSLLSNEGHAEAIRSQQAERLRRRLDMVRNRLDQAYQDKPDGKIAADFWERKASEWQTDERGILAAMREAESLKPERFLDAVRILKLANKAYFLYVKQSPQEKAKLLRMVLSNCAIDATNIYPTYRKPFDLIFHQAKNERPET